MSRGLGHVQRKIIDALADGGWRRIDQLAQAVYGTDAPPEPQLIATRRAVRGLVARDLARTWQGSTGQPRTVWNPRLIREVPADDPAAFGIRPAYGSQPAVGFARGREAQMPVPCLWVARPLNDEERAEEEARLAAFRQRLGR